ncbi:MAG: DUF4062 domain-containing protein [bacterium]
MISSRCEDLLLFEGKKQKMSKLRSKIKEKIENYKPFGSNLFECWINEDAPPAEGTEDSWEHCITQVKNCDLLIVLYNGNAGWAKSGGDIGICHAELSFGLDTGRAKVYLIELPTSGNPGNPDEIKRNKLFREFKNDQSQFRGMKAKNGEDVIKLINTTLHEAVVNMVKLGVREARKGRHDTGDALNWNRLSMYDRKTQIESIIHDCLKSRPNSKIKEHNSVYVKLDNELILFQIHGIPAAMSISAAREMVGRPFIKDFEYASILKGGKAGPIHIIGCHKGVTETQAINVIGHPDVTIVTPPFGIYIVDNYQMIQLLFLSDCRDETTTRHAVQRSLEWLLQSGEDKYLCKRAKARKKIINTIAKEKIIP